jgi:hypothetical protein
MPMPAQRAGSSGSSKLFVNYATSAAHGRSRPRRLRWFTTRAGSCPHIVLWCSDGSGGDCLSHIPVGQRKADAEKSRRTRDVDRSVASTQVAKRPLQPTALEARGRAPFRGIHHIRQAPGLASGAQSPRANLHLNEPRYASLPNIMKPRKRPVETVKPADLGIDVMLRLKALRVEEPPKRQAGTKSASVKDLVASLAVSQVSCPIRD